MPLSIGAQCVNRPGLACLARPTPTAKSSSARKSSPRVPTRYERWRKLGRPVAPTRGMIYEYVQAEEAGASSSLLKFMRPFHPTKIVYDLQSYTMTTTIERLLALPCLAD